MSPPVCLRHVALCGLLALVGCRADEAVDPPRSAPLEASSPSTTTGGEAGALPEPDEVVPDASSPSGPSPLGALDASVDKSLEWMAEFPRDELRFDAAIGLSAVARLRKGQANPHLAAALQKATARAERDHDNPLLRLWKPDFRVAKTVVTSWKAPEPGQRRINVNRPVAEALHCDRHGLRDQTVRYIVGPMRDDAGYHTAHGLWALTLARDLGCLQAPRYRELSGPLIEELANAMEPAFEPKSTADVDLYAERVLMLLLAGDQRGSIDGWVTTLLRLQRPDGSWGLDDDAPPAHRYHATVLGAWAIAADAHRRRTRIER